VSLCCAKEGLGERGGTVGVDVREEAWHVKEAMGGIV
jgi:hypothetical protein